MSLQVCAACGASGEFTGPKCPACAAPPLAPGAVFGKYTLTSEIGRGSMGVVHDAQDNTLHRRVALKIMHSRRGGEPKEAVNDWQRFIQEARLTANVAKHSNIVTVYEAAVHDSRRYIAMEFIAGEPFGRWRKGRSTREQIRLLRDVALAVHHAHEHGIIHRDLKPGNVLVGKGGVPVVTDFGLATWERKGTAESLTPTGYAVGSPAYMSPEQARGQKDLGRATDIYSLGIMIYEAIAGAPPFGGKNPVETLSKVVEGVTVKPSQAAPSPGGDPDLDAICMKAIAREPKDRYATAAELASALTRWFNQDMPDRRRPRPHLLILGALVIALTCVLVWNQRAASLREDQMRASLADREQKLAAMNAAASAPPVAVALETFQPRAAAQFNESTAAKMSFYSPGAFDGGVRVAETGDYELTVTASGTEALGELPKFRLTLDGKLLGDVLLTSIKQQPYPVPAHVAAGDHVLGIEFINDFYDKETRQDRNLFIHQIVLRRTK